MTKQIINSWRDIMQITEKFGIEILTDEEFSSSSVEYGSQWLDSRTLETWSSSYSQDGRNLIFNVLRKLEKAGFLKIVSSEWERTCLSSTCPHCSHDAETFVSATVEY